MNPKKIHVNMPLKIPQNILDVAEKYRQWRQDGIGCKQTILEEMDKVVKRWHRYTGYSACVGTFEFSTNVGVSIKIVATEPEGLRIDWFIGAAQYGRDSDKLANVRCKQYTNKRGTYVYHFQDDKPKKKPWDHRGWHPDPDKRNLTV